MLFLCSKQSHTQSAHCLAKVVALSVLKHGLCIWVIYNYMCLIIDNMTIFSNFKLHVNGYLVPGSHWKKKHLQLS